MQRKRQRYSSYKNSSGFTLLELMVVIAIVGVLASIALTSFISTRTKVLEAAALAEARTLGKVVFNAFLDGIDVDLTHNVGDGPAIGEFDNFGNPRAPLFKLSNGLVAEISGGSNAGGSGIGVCDADVWHPSSPLKKYTVFIDETLQVSSFPTE